jgi:DNA-binding CsgD family transcriptional regulator
MSHVVIGAFCTRRLAIVDADVASERGGSDVRHEAVSEAALTLGRTRGPCGAEWRGGGPAAEEDAGGEGGIAWLSSGRCLIGIWRSLSAVAPFVALVRDRSGQAFPGWLRDVVRIGLIYESGRLAWARPAEPPAGPVAAAPDEIMRHLSVACAIVDAGRTVVYANRAAGQWIAGQDDLALVRGRLTAGTPELQRRLLAAVRAATTDEPRSAQALVLNAGHRDGPPQVVTCLPLPDAEAQALLIFGEKSRCTELADVLLNAFGLTSAERRLARQLLVGRTLEEAAEAARIRISTARSYLKAIFAKTGVRRQSEFVAVVGALVPPVAGSAQPVELRPPVVPALLAPIARRA